MTNFSLLTKVNQESLHKRFYFRFDIKLDVKINILHNVINVNLLSLEFDKYKKHLIFVFVEPNKEPVDEVTLQSEFKAGTL